MAREIKFRAKSIPNGKFVYGMPLPSSFGCGYMLNIEDALGADFYHSRYTMPRCSSSVPIDEDTVGEFTGHKYFNGPDDTDGTEIYEDDIVLVKSAWGVKSLIGRVVYDVNSCRFLIFNQDDNGYLSMFNDNNTYEVLGNIYDNPELLNK